MRKIAAAGLIAAANASPAFAHHVMDGKTPATFFEGLLSGLGHPVIELPHFVAILLVGVVAARLTVGLAPIAAFVIGSFVGTLVVGVLAGLPVDETWVVASVAVVAVLMLLRGQYWLVAAILFAIGVVHGTAFAEAIAGAEPTPLAAYLLGLAGTEFVIAGAAYFITAKFSRAAPAATDR
jgi:urease accessory protein